MTNDDMPKDGDFVAYLERKTRDSSSFERVGGSPKGATFEQEEPSQPARDARRQTIVDVLVEGEAPTEEFLEEFNALEGADALSDEELERQALQHPGEDRNPLTPE